MLEEGILRDLIRVGYTCTFYLVWPGSCLAIEMEKVSVIRMCSDGGMKLGGGGLRRC